MKAYFALLVLCAVATSSVARRSIRRRLHPDEEIAALVRNEFVLSELHAVMVSRENPVGVSSRNVPCSSPSARWLQGQVSSLSDEDLSNFFDWNVYTLPFAYKLFVEPRERQGREYFGLDGEYSRDVRRTLRRAREFWSGCGVGDDIRLLCAHGSDLANRHEKLVPTLEVLFGSSYDEDYTVYDHADDIQDLIMRLPGGYNYPLLTFNAFATEEVDESEPPSIVIGDGYFDFQRSIGLISEGPEYALSHEHAHHLQFALDLPEENFAAAQNDRRKELMADAISGYFLAHDRGGAMTTGEIERIYDVAYSVGDCEISNDGHHGTPYQRRCATIWGAALAHSPEFAVIDLIELKKRFDAWYGRLDDLDDSCEHSDSAAYSADYGIIAGLQFAAVLLGSASLFLF